MKSEFQWSRRSFLKTGVAIGLGVWGLQSLAANQSLKFDAPGRIGYGALERDPNGLLNLPKGFQYNIIARSGDVMEDGLLLPGKPDGMAAFAAPNGKVLVARNHELNPGDFDICAYGKNLERLNRLLPSDFYDYGRGVYPGLGGVTAFLFNEETQQVEKCRMALAGTTTNCAGGVTPWGSWLTCEEATVRPAAGKLEKEHGYVFEVPLSPDLKLAKPEPIKAMGRFVHEAVSVDPKTGIVYMTEDRHDSLIYRFIPNVKGRLHEGGRLQALKIKALKSWDTRNWPELIAPVFPSNKEFDVEWVDLRWVESPEDDLRFQGYDLGAARFARGEGMWFGDNEFYFTCTNGGKIKKGQIFRYKLGMHEAIDGGTLELFLESDNADVLKYCDNMTIAPWGDLFVCEDDDHPFIVGVTPQGELYRFAENVGYESEFGGVSFSPSGKTMFVNIQQAGLTLAVTGPFRKK